MPETMRKLTVEARQIPIVLSEAEDQTVAGRYVVEVSAALSDDKAASVALDAFHSTVPIDVLEEFEVQVFDEQDNGLDEDLEHEVYSGTRHAGSVTYAGPARLPVQAFEAFASLLDDLSPENVGADGEATLADITARVERVEKEWKSLQERVGREVTHEEISAELSGGDCDEEEGISMALDISDPRKVSQVLSGIMGEYMDLANHLYPVSQLLAICIGRLESPHDNETRVEVINDLKSANDALRSLGLGASDRLSEAVKNGGGETARESIRDILSKIAIPRPGSG